VALVALVAGAKVAAVALVVEQVPW